MKDNSLERMLDETLSEDQDSLDVAFETVQDAKAAAPRLYSAWDTLVDYVALGGWKSLLTGLNTFNAALNAAMGDYGIAGLYVFCAGLWGLQAAFEGRRYHTIRGHLEQHGFDEDYLRSDVSTGKYKHARRAALRTGHETEFTARFGRP